MAKKKKSKSKKNRIAFVLPGGGSLGAVQVGMMRALMEADIYPDFIIGSSVGAINGAFLAGNPTLEGVSELENVWRRMRNGEVFAPSPVGGVMSLLGMNNHICDPGGLRRLITRNLPFKNLEDAEIPVHITATNILNGHTKFFSRGPAAEALLASAAIPGIFPPAVINGSYYADASISNHVAVEPAIQEGIKEIYILPTGFTCSIKKPPPDMLGMAMQSVFILLGRQLTTSIALYGKKARFRILPPLCPVETQMHDFSATESLMERAHRTSRIWLERFGVKAGIMPSALEPHEH